MQIQNELDFLLRTDPRSVADLMTVTRMDILPWADEYAARSEETLSVDLAINSPFAVPEGYHHFYEKAMTYIDEEKVTPDGGVKIERFVGREKTKIPLFIGKTEILSCLEEPQRTTPLLGYSADSTYVLVVTNINFLLERDSTVASGTMYGYLFSK